MIEKEQERAQNRLAPPQKTEVSMQRETDRQASEESGEVKEEEKGFGIASPKVEETTSEGSVGAVNGSEGKAERTNDGDLHDEDVTNKPNELTSKPTETTQPERDGHLKQTERTPNSQRTHKPSPSKRTLTLIHTAVSLRAQGKTWAEVAPEIGRKSKGSARRLPHEHPEEWAIASKELLEKLKESIGPKALLKLGKRIDKSDKDMTEVAAASSVLRYLGTIEKKVIEGKIDHTHHEETGMEDWEKDEISDLRERLRAERARQKDRVRIN